MWDAIPLSISAIIFFILMCFVGIMEGMQIAFLAVVKIPGEQLDLTTTTIAKKNCELAFKGENFKAFLIGRQICVTICMFVIAQITTIDIGDDDENIFGVSDGVQSFFDTGL